VLKDLTKKDYALNAGDLSVEYQAARYGLDKLEKDNLDLFYYIRNALVHYNGAYYAGKSIDVSYQGHRFVSAGHEGERIFIPSLNVAYAMHLDLEAYTYKAWGNYMKYVGRKT